ncbi:MAG: GntR family transcriptional regulator [Lautropia sp.]
MASPKKPFTKVSARIRGEIERAIREAVLLPGDPIDEEKLAARFKVSRTPIREALIQLEAQGMVTSIPRSGMIVAKMDLQQLLTLWELLAELEGVAARLACQRMSASDLDELVRHQASSAAVAKANDVAGWQESNLRFHELIYRATRNPYLRQEVLHIRTRTGYYRRHAFAALGHIATSFEQHQRIVDAFRSRDGVAAGAAMVEHMRPAPDAKGLTEFLVNLPQACIAR